MIAPRLRLALRTWWRTAPLPERFLLLLAAAVILVLGYALALGLAAAGGILLLGYALALGVAR